MILLHAWVGCMLASSTVMTHDDMLWHWGGRLQVVLSYRGLGRDRHALQLPGITESRAVKARCWNNCKAV